MFIYFIQIILVMHSQTQQYTTPKKRHLSQQFTDIKHNTTRLNSKAKHIPIFPNKKKKLGRIFNTNHQTLQNQKISCWEIINFDFCGCEDGITPCSVLVQNFLKNVSLNTMKSSYLSQSYKTKSQAPAITNLDKQGLFKILPKNYPQVYFSHLNNLVQIIGISRYRQPEFECLYSIQYHSKVEYLTYYLYQDMKNYYSNYDHFLNQLDDQLIKLNSSRIDLHYLYDKHYLSTNLDKFITNYFDSIGANLVPLPYYSKFMAAVYKKGKIFMVKLLAKFIVERRKNMEQGLIFLRRRDIQNYRSYMRELNFQVYIQQCQ